MAELRSRGLILALAGLAALAVVTDLAYEPPAPRPLDAPAAEFSAQRAKAELDALIGDSAPHPIGSAAGARIRAKISARLTALGYSVETESGPVCHEQVCGFPVNLIATLPDKPGAGRTPEGDVVLAAHYDSVPAGPGAADDGASVAAVLEIARILALRPPSAHHATLLIDDGEEAGLLGAFLFVRDHPAARGTSAAVNLEARGTSGPSLMFETGAANTWLMQLYGHAVARPVTNSLYYVIYKLLPNDTDFTAFRQASYQGYNLAFIGDVGQYHTPLDDADHLSLRSLQHQGDNALAALSALLQARTPPISSSESVFFDVFGRVLVAWPSSRTLPAALLALALLLAQSLVLVRTRAASLRGVAWSALVVIAAPLAATLLCGAMVAALMAIGAVPAPGSAPWIAHPLPMTIGATAVAAAAVAASCQLVASRASALSLWIAAALTGGVIAVTLAALAPGASFPFLVASAAAVLGALPAVAATLARDAPSSSAIGLAATLPALSLFVACAALLEFLYPALGSPAWPIATLVLSLVAGYLLPLLLLGGRRARMGVLRLSAAAAAIGILVAAPSSPYSRAWPERVNLEYWVDADSGRAHYYLTCDSGHLPPSMAAAAQFDRTRQPRFPGSAQRGFVAPAPTVALDAPELTARLLPPFGGGASPANAVRMELSLRSRRAAPEASVIFPAGGQVRTAQIDAGGGPMVAQLREIQGGATLLQFAALPAEGVRFSIEWRGPLPAFAQVIDRSYGLAMGADVAGRRPATAIASQSGDATIVHRTVTLR